MGHAYLGPSSPKVNRERQALLADWITRIVDEGVNLTVWEEAFTEKAEGWAAFTEKQSEIIERIYTERVP